MADPRTKVDGVERLTAEGPWGRMTMSLHSLPRRRYLPLDWLALWGHRGLLPSVAPSYICRAAPPPSPASRGGKCARCEQLREALAMFAVPAGEFGLAHHRWEVARHVLDGGMVAEVLDKYSISEWHER